jgi:hypothetical protein
MDRCTFHHYGGAARNLSKFHERQINTNNTLLLSESRAGILRSAQEAFEVIVIVIVQTSRNTIYNLQRLQSQSDRQPNRDWPWGYNYIKSFTGIKELKTAMHRGVLE